MDIQVACRSVVAVFALASVASAQVPLPVGPGRCGGVRIAGGSSKPATTLIEPRNFKVRGSGVCSEYSISGWPEKMRLYLGEGAADYLPMILKAVNLWNTALRGFNQQDVIGVTNRSPRRFNLSSDFWSSPDRESERNLDDGQSVIYFKGGGDPSNVYSYAHYKSNPRSNRMVEVDIYINTTHEEIHGRNLAKTYAVEQWDDDYGIYATVNSTYLTLVHEVGHALGLRHVPVSGNIMSYNYMPLMIDRWNVPLSMFFLQMIVITDGQLDENALPFLHRNDDMSPYMILSREDLLMEMELFTDSVALGEQDRMALMCVYDFEDWNH